MTTPAKIQKVRTRIAPSPTGDPHVGTAYIALFNKAFAAAHDGEFVLRIEDTDQARSTAESEVAIMNSMKWLGLTWNEGPDCGGEHGPYRQSERKDIYKKYSDELLEKGHAFHCFCSSERLQEARDKPQEEGQRLGYDGLCRGLSKEDVAEKLAAGESSVVRMDVPDEGVCTVPDMLRDPISIDYTMVDYQVLLKSDGMPSYHLACVVDDHLMEISHVIRGEEWISSTPKHVLLYQYFDWQAPVFCHLPLLRNADKSKLSKRKNPTSVDYYRRLGVLPEALVNYLGMMGWTMPNGEEKFTLDEMVANFDLNRVSLGGPVFDTDKLQWLNAKWIRENYNSVEFAELLKEWAFNSDYIQKFLPMVQERVELLSDVAPVAQMFFSGMPDISKESFSHIKYDEETLQKVLQLGLWKLETQRHWTVENIKSDLFALGDHLELKIRDIVAPYFIAIAGQANSVSVFEAMEVLGPDMSRGRIRHALNTVGAPSKKKLKKLEKEFRALS
jgi:glutamyl-tRNA synthetase